MAGKEKKYLSPVTAHLLEAALPALAFQFTDEGLAARIASGNFDEHPRWLQWLTVSKPLSARPPVTPEKALCSAMALFLIET